MSAPYQGVRVTAEDIATGDDGEQVIWHDYVLVTAGDCKVEHTNVHFAKDGTQTHVITVKGIRKGVRS